MAESLDVAELERLARALVQTPWDCFKVFPGAGDGQWALCDGAHELFTGNDLLRLLVELRRCRDALALYADESNWLELNSDQTTPSILPGWVGPGDSGRSVAAAALDPARG